MAIKISGSTIIDDDRNIVNAGVVTATLFSGDGSGLTGVGVGTEDSINTSGIITAYAVYAEQFEGFGDELIFSPTPTAFSPIDGSVDNDLEPTISITFDQNLELGIGSVSLRDGSAGGSEIESIGITSANISGQTLSFTPSTLPTDTDVYVVVPQGLVTNSLKGNNAEINTYNFTTVDFAFLSITPPDGATNVGVGTSVSLTFTSPPSQGTGTIYIREGSAGGTTYASYDASSASEISIDGNTWHLQLALDYGYEYFTVIPSTAITNYAGLNTTGTSTHSFTTLALNLGDAFGGGYLICASGGTRWVVSPSSATVIRNWYIRSDSNTRAQEVSGCTGWFVPSSGQLQNPGFVCRTYWDSVSSSDAYRHWSNTQAPNPDSAGFRGVNISMSSNCCGYNDKASNFPIRSFRTVSY